VTAAVRGLVTDSVYTTKTAEADPPETETEPGVTRLGLLLEIAIAVPAAAGLLRLTVQEAEPGATMTTGLHTSEVSVGGAGGTGTLLLSKR
jgi:hypothetical protein